MRLMDADVCIDLQRKFPPAIAWLASLTAPVAIPGFVAIELIVGCENKAALLKVQNFLARFPAVRPSEADMKRAVAEYASFRLSHNLGGFDALIAATAVGRGDELLTFNEKHFRAVPGLIFSKPYQK